MSTTSGLSMCGTPFSGQSIVFVGNRKPERDLSQAIDAHDWVFRFSHMPFVRTGLIGTRTDAVHLEANGGYRENLHRDPINCCNVDRLAAVKFITMRRRWLALDLLVSLSLLGRPLLILDERLALDVARPTSGFMLIRHAMRHPLFAGARVSICGFTANPAEKSPDLSWHRDDLPKERAEIAQLVAEGRITRLDE